MSGLPWMRRWRKRQTEPCDREVGQTKAGRTKAGRTKAGRKEAGDKDAGEAGFVLLSVLLAAAVFTTAAASLAVKSKLLAMQEANRAVAARDDALADGIALFGIDLARRVFEAAAASATSERAASHRAGVPSPEALLAAGMPLPCALADGRSIELLLVDQAGLLDLNAAPAEMIVDILAGAGFESAEAARLSGEILDFRDDDDLPETGGVSEKTAYGQAGRPWGPRNGAFLDAGDAAQLPSASTEILTRLLPLVTVFNGAPALDFAAMERRTRMRFPKVIEPLSPLARWQKPTPAQSFAVEARLRRADASIAATRLALVSFASASPEGGVAPAEGGSEPAGNGGFRILQWRAGASHDVAPAVGRSDPALCRRLVSALAL